MLGLASEANLDEAVELMVEDRLVGAPCEVEAMGFDLTRTRPARALSRWSRTVSLAAIPMPSLPSVPASTLLAWQLGALRSWDIPCDAPKALAHGEVDWGEAAPRIDFSSLAKALAKRVLFLTQTQGGVVFGFFANCPLSGAVRGSDPAPNSAIFVLEHPTGEQRRWQLQEPNCEITVNEEFLWFGAGLLVHAVGCLFNGRAPEFGMTEVDAGFVSLKWAWHEGRFMSRILRWEVWSV
jgi:hypothetical protein